MKNGLFIVLEGIDGSGTTTQLNLLTEHFRNEGYTVHPTAEPSNWPIGQLIRRVLSQKNSLPPASLALAFAADRLDHLEKEILPKLQEGALVIADRYVLSSLAYQSLNTSTNWVKQINHLARAPDLSILLKISSQVAAQRRAIRNTAQEIFDSSEQQRTIAKNYDEIFTHQEFGPKTTIDAHPSIPEVTNALLTKINALISKHEKR